MISLIVMFCILDSFHIGYKLKCVEYKHGIRPNFDIAAMEDANDKLKEFENSHYCEGTQYKNIIEVQTNKEDFWSKYNIGRNENIFITKFDGFGMIKVDIVYKVIMRL